MRKLIIIFASVLVLLSCDDNSTNGKNDDGDGYYDDGKPVIYAIYPDTLKVKDRIVISGRNFGTDRGSKGKVLFDSTEAAGYLYWSDTDIICKLPPKAFDGKIYVLHYNSLSNGYPFKVNITPWEKLELLSSFSGLKVTVTLFNEDSLHKFEKTYTNLSFQNGSIYFNNTDVERRLDFDRSSFTIKYCVLESLTVNGPSSLPCGDYPCSRTYYYPKFQAIPLIFSDNNTYIFELSGNIGSSYALIQEYRPDKDNNCIKISENNEMTIKGKIRLTITVN